MHKASNDTELLRQLQDSESRNRGFQLLVTEYQKPIYFYVRRMLIDHDDTNDVVQNVFIKAWKGIAQFRGDCKLSSWLYKIANNESITFINNRKKIAGIPIGEIAERMPGHLQDDELYSGDEISRKLDSAITALPEKQKLVFLLKYFEDKPYEEIAEITGTSVGGLKANYHHAVSKIKEFLENS